MITRPGLSVCEPDARRFSTTLATGARQPAHQNIPRFLVRCRSCFWCLRETRGKLRLGQRYLHLFMRNEDDKCKDGEAAASRDQLSVFVGIDRRFLLGSTVGSCWDRPSGFAGIDRKLQGELC
jgi:hypothetical protein